MVEEGPGAKSTKEVGRADPTNGKTGKENGKAGQTNGYSALQWRRQMVGFGLGQGGAA